MAELTSEPPLIHPYLSRGRVGLPTYSATKVIHQLGKAFQNLRGYYIRREDSLSITEAAAAEEFPHDAGGGNVLGADGVEEVEELEQVRGLGKFFAILGHMF